MAEQGVDVGVVFVDRLIADPRRYGIDLVMPIFFSAMLIPLWRGTRRSVPWVVAGVVALIVQQLIGGWWFIVAGAIAGSVAGGFLDDASLRMVTSETATEKIVEALESGADEYLMKPFTQDALVEKLELARSRH